MSKKLILPILVCLVVGGGVWIWLSKRASSPTYREVPAHIGDITLSILATGTVQPENRLEIKPPIAGRVEQVLVKEGQKVQKGQILVWMSSTERAALLDAARSQGAEEVKKWEDLYRPTPVLAPINGTIILRSTESGQTFTTADAILVMSDRLTVKAQVDETDIAKIKLKQRAELVLDAYSDTTVPAQVDQIAFEAKAVNNVTTYLVDVLPDKTPDFMRAGMTANVTFFVESKNQILVVPTEAIRFEGAGPSVLVKSATGSPVTRVISVGISDGKNTEILSGLVDGDLLLTKPLAIPGSKPKGGINPFSPVRRGGRGH